MNQPYPQNQPYSQEWLNQPWGVAARLLTEAWNMGYLGALALGRVPPVTWSSPNQNGGSIELQRLGEGAHGQVGKLKLRYQEWDPFRNYFVPVERTCAIKFIPEAAGVDTRVGELKVLHNIPASSNVISYYGWHRLSSPGFRFVVLYMELCPGALSDFIASLYYTNLTPEQKRVGNWDIVRQIAVGLKTCHDTNLMHRDLKINNILYAGPHFALDGSQTYCFKIADFGVARLSSPTNSFLTAPPLVPDYLPPEIVSGKYDRRVDLFSLGHAMWQLTCSSPAPDLDFQNLYRDLKSVNPDARPSLDTILDVANKKLRDASLPTPVPHAIQYLIRPPNL